MRCKSTMRAGKIKFTVITICKNAEKNIADTMRSVLEQTYTHMEYIICDGLSEDNTIEIIHNISKEYNDTHKIRFFSQRDSGIYNAMNIGTKKARGDYILFLNAGDRFYDSFVLEKVAQKMEECDAGKNKGIFYGIAHRVNTRKKDKYKDFSKLYRSVPQGFLKGDMPCHQSIFAYRKCLLKQGFNEQYRFRADFDWLIGCYKRHILLKNLDMIICDYDDSGTTARIKHKRKLKDETEQILKKYYPIRYRLVSLWRK